MKRVFYFFLIILIFSSGIYVKVLPSKNNEYFNIAYQKNILNNIPEKDEVISSFERDKKIILSGAKNYLGKKFIELELKNSLKMYYLKPIDVFSGYKSGKKFYELISDDCYYTIPITWFGINKGLIHLQKNKKVDEKELLSQGFSKESIKMIKDDEGKITLTQIGPMIKDGGYEFFMDPDKMDKLLKRNNITNIIDIRFITGLHMDIAYINASSGEYCIPFLSRPDFAKITNGKVYNIDDIIRIFKMEK